MRFQAEEIEGARLSDINEDEKLNNQLAVLENVEKLNWTVTSQPFVSRQAYPHRQLEKDGWYVTTHSSTPFKKKQIEDLSKKFKLRLKVEIV